jgi:MFS family permease
MFSIVSRVVSGSRSFDPARAALIAATATATVLGLAGTFLGVLRLLSYGRAVIFQSIYLVHPDLQLFGFVAIFIIGVSYGLVPRFKNKPAPPLPFFLLLVSLVFVGNLLRLTGLGAVVGDIIVLIGFIGYTALTIVILGRPRGFFWVSDVFISLSPILLTVTSAARLFLQQPWPDMRFVELALLGFPTAMIVGVAMRTVRFRLGANYHRGFAVVCLFSYLAALLLLPFQQRYLQDIRRAIFLSSGIFFLASVDIAKPLKNGFKETEMNQRDRIRHRYFTTYFTTAAAWFAAALTLALLQGVWPFFRDGFIHSMAVGFIANTIMAYAPILMPALMSGRAAVRGLSYAPHILINSGNLWRIGASMFSKLHDAYLSGLPILAGAIYFLVMVHRLR